MCNACQLSGLSAMEGVYGGKRIFKFNFSSFIIHSNFKKRSKFIIEFMTAKKSYALVCDASTEFDQ